MNPDKTTLLVVDDEPMNQLIISEYLKSADEDYAWDTAEDGMMAWEMLQQQPLKYSAIFFGAERLTSMTGSKVPRIFPSSTSQPLGISIEITGIWEATRF